MNKKNDTEVIPFAKPYIGKEEEKAVLTVLRSGWLTTGKETLAFEKDFEDFLKAGSGKHNRVRKSGSGAPDGADENPLYCMAVNSATSGLHLALEACGIKKGDLVLLPSMTFTSTAEVIRYLGAEAVFVDVRKGSYHIDPAALEHTLSGLEKGTIPLRGRTRRGKAAAVMLVHFGGLPCDMDAILPIAKKYGLKVIEDSAHAFPSLIPAPSPRPPLFAGTMGDAGVFSFYATKTVTSGEGGMVVTRNKAIADRIKIMRSHGIDRSIWDRYTDTKASWYYEVVEPGFKYNIPDILSALGRVQLRRCWDLFAMRKEIAQRYDKAFANDGHFILPPTGPADARHIYPLRLKLEKLSIDRTEFAAKMQERGIGISVHFIPLHIMPYYKKRYSLEDVDFPETLDTFKRTISLPVWPGMTEAQVKRVITVVKTLGSEYNK